MARKKRANPGNWSHSGHDILNGKASIFRVKQSGDVWQFRMWIPDEQRHVRKSLKTRDLETAISRAEKRVLETLTNIRMGKKVFGITLQELVDLFLEWREDHVAAGEITPGRLITIRTQLNHVLAFKGGDIQISELDRNSFYDYATWRRKNFQAQDITIRNEQSTINMMIDKGYREGVVHFDKLDFKKIRISQDEVGVRDDFTLEEYDDLIRFLRSYVSKKECEDDHKREERLMVRDAFFIATNTLLRPGELHQLQWRDIKSIKKRKDSTGREVSLVEIHVRKETSKTRNARIIVTRGGEYVARLKKRAVHTRPKDFLFTEIGGTRKLSKRKWYLHWKNMMEGIGIPHYQERKLTWYSTRHFGCGMRIRAGNSYAEISKLMGTSITHIEVHYAKWDIPMKVGAALKNFTTDDEGIVIQE